MERRSALGHASAGARGHELSFARQVSNQVIFMENGLIVESGSAEAFFAQPQKERTIAFLKGLDRMKTV